MPRSRAYGTAPRSARRRVAGILAAIVAGLVAGPGVGSPGTASAVRCSSPPPAGAAEAGVPWPQARFDLAAVGKITDGSSVTVAVVDSGVDASHPQLVGAVLGGGDTLDPTGDGRDDCLGHGTAVASIIAARPLAGAGLRGVAPGVRILAVRVSERVDTATGVTGAGDMTALVEGIRRAVTARPRPQVLNLSISTGIDNPDLRAVVRQALDADIVVVAAVGNQYDQGNPRPYPASYDGVVGVGAIGPSGVRVPSSQVGSYVDVVAPGDGIVAAAPGGGYLAYQGTSFAAPFVSATVALIRARWPQLNRIEVVRRLLATADPAAGARPSSDYGYGVVNPMRALTEIVPPDAGAPVAPPWPVIQPGHAKRASTPGPSPLALVAAAVLLLAAAAIVTAIATISARTRKGIGERRPPLS